MKRTSKKQIHELEKHVRETIDESAMLYARYEKDATGNAYAFINGKMYIYKSNSAMYDAVADMVLYPDETAAAQDEAAKAVEEACKAIEATESGDAAAIAEHYSAAEEHADNARKHARKAHTYAADEAARNAANAVIEAEMAITEKAHDIAEAIADEANATNAQRIHANMAAFAELTAQPWKATAEDRAAVNAMVDSIAKATSPTRYGMTEAESIADAAACSLLSAYTAATFEDYSDEQAQAAFRVAAAELIPEGQRPAGYETASEADRAAVAAMVERIAEEAETAAAYAAFEANRREHIGEYLVKYEWSGEGLYRIAWSDGGQKSDPHHYETAEELAADLTSAYQHATETHQPYAERLEYYERYELESYLGEPSDFDVEAIEAEATDTDEHGARYWTADAEELEAIAQRNRR